MFKLSLIFVCGLSSVLIADGTPIDTFLQQIAPENSPNLHLVLHVSEILYTAMGGDIPEENDRNSIVPAWESIITTMNSPKATETFRFASAEMEEMIKDKTVQQSLINIFATCFTYLTHAVGESDGENVRLLWKELRNAVLGNNKRVLPKALHEVGKMMPDSSDREQFRIMGNSDENLLNEVVQEIMSKEGSLESDNQYDPRNLERKYSEFRFL